MSILEYSPEYPVAFAPRPDRFVLGPALPPESDVFACAITRPALRAHTLDFSDSGRNFSALIVLGEDVTDERGAEALAIMDSLHAGSPTRKSTPTTGSGATTVTNSDGTIDVTCPNGILHTSETRTRIPVAGPPDGDVVGYVDVADLYCSRLDPESTALGPEVRNDSGELVGYVVGNLGFVDLATASDPERLEERRKEIEALETP